jgi:hypothetical protein
MTDNNVVISTDVEPQSIHSQIEELKNLVQFMIQDLLSKQSVYDELRRRTPAAPRDAKEAAKASAEEARSELEFVQSALATLVSSNNSLTSPALPSPNPTHSDSGSLLSQPQTVAGQDSHKRVQRIKIRPFHPDKPGTKADHYWTYFTGLCLNNKLNTEESFLLLSNACDEGRSQNWFRLNFFESKTPPETLHDAKVSFYAAFLSPNWKTDRFFELLLTLWRPNESVAGYFERFSNAATMFESSVATTELAEATLLKDLFWYHMPTTVRRTLGSKDHQRDFVSCQDLFLFVNSGFPGVPSDVAESQRTIRSILQKSLESTVGTQSRPSIPPRLGKKMYCAHCQTTTHDTEFCRKRKATSGLQERARPPMNSHRGKDYDEMKKKGVCFRCGTTWDKGHRCVKADSPDYGKGLVFRRTFIDEDDAISSHLDDLPILASLQVSTAKDHQKFLKAPILLNNLKVLGGIDTYASHSFVSPSLVKELNVAMVPIEGKIILGAASSMANRTGRVLDVNVTVRTSTGYAQRVKHTFEVLDMGEDCNCLLGLDLLPKLGITVENIPAAFPSDDDMRAEDDDTFGDTPEDDTPKDEKDPLLALAQKAAWEVLDSVEQDNTQNTINHPYYAFLFRKQLREDLLKNVFQQNEAIHGLCTAKNAEIALDTTSDDPIHVKQYRVNYRLRPHIESQIKKWLEQGAIRRLEEHTHWNTPIVVVPKRDVDSTVKGWRVCLDLRPLNLLIKSVNYPLPLIKDILESLSGCVVFTRLDLRSSFNQIRIQEDHQIKTTFTWDGAQYCFVGAPFGLKHISSVFQKIMHSLLHHLKFVKYFIDDIIIHSKTHAEHIQHIRIVMQILNENKLIVNIGKCILAVHRIVVLGHQIDRRGISLAADKVLALENWTLPKNSKQLARHLGFFNYFRELIPLYSKITEPLERLRNLSSFKSAWTQQHTQIYETLKTIMLSKIVLHYPDFRKPFSVATDASSKGLGGCLYQVDDQGQVQYVSFASRSLTDGERNYGATQRELAGIIFCLKHFEYYLYGSHFKLYTDHRALSFLFTQKKLSPHVQNWMEVLLSFDMDVIYRPGVINILPDRISRLYDDDPVTDSRDPVIWSIPAIVSQDPTKDCSVHPDKRQELLHNQHLLGHFGTAQIVQGLINQGKYWPSMRHDATELVKACIQCQRYNIGRHGFHPLKSITADLPLDHMAMDLKELPVSKSNCKYMLVLVDVFTRFVFLRPLKNKSAKVVSASLFEIFCDIGFPKILQSDNGREFVNDVNARFCKFSRIERRMITPYHARGNGLAEKMVDVCASTLLKLVNGQVHAWDKYVPATQFFVNTKIASTTSSTPYSLMFARAPNHFTGAAQSIPPDNMTLIARLQYLTDVVYPAIRVKIDAINTSRATLFAKHHRIISDDVFKPGAMVMALDELRSNKTSPRYTGPFIVQHRNRGGAYQIKGPDGTTYSRPPSVLKLVSSEIPFSQDSTVVDHVLDHKRTNIETLYLVKWKDQSLMNQWVSEHAFDDLGPISAYWKAKGSPKAALRPTSPTEVNVPRVKLRLNPPTRRTS